MTVSLGRVPFKSSPVPWPPPTFPSGSGRMSFGWQAQLSQQPARGAMGLAHSSSAS